MRPTKVLVAKLDHNMLDIDMGINATCCVAISLIGLLSLASSLGCRSHAIAELLKIAKSENPLKLRADLRCQKRLGGERPVDPIELRHAKVSATAASPVQPQNRVLARIQSWFGVNTTTLSNMS
jgi:hypothetical protein